MGSRNSLPSISGVDIVMDEGLRDGNGDVNVDADADRELDDTSTGTCIRSILGGFRVARWPFSR